MCRDNKSRRGLNQSESINVFTSTRLMPLAVKSACICGLVTRVRSANEWMKRITSQEIGTMKGKKPR